jgi:hypothetical protein
VSIGFVYILLNPAFPKELKIGRTARDSYKRARELSRQTGVPHDFVVIYDELVSDAERVEAILHERFDSFRVNRSKEFFTVPSKDAIRALQEVAMTYQVSPTAPRMVVNLLPHFVSRFSAYLDPRIVAIRFVQLPDAYLLEVDKRKAGGDVTTVVDDVPLSGLTAPNEPTIASLGANESLLRKCDAYDWINLSADLFAPQAVERIAAEWHTPGGPIEKLRERQAAQARRRADP